MVAIMLLSSCYPIRRVGLLQDREGLPEYEKDEYEQYHLQKNDELELRVISMNPETALLFQQRASSYLSNNSSSFTYRIYADFGYSIPREMIEKAKPYVSYGFMEQDAQNQDFRVY